MTDYVAVLPSIYPPWTQRCLASCDWDVLVIDNTVDNTGVGASWNIGAQHCLDTGADWLIIMSAALRFGEPRGEDFLAALDANEGAIAVEAAHGIGWHLIAFARSTLERVGLFDENFWPAYFEDIDYARRVLVALAPGEEQWWPKVTVDIAMAGVRHGVDLGGVKDDPDALLSYYRRKWGGDPGLERWSVPFNDPTHDVRWWPTPPDPRALVGGHTPRQGAV